MIDRLAKQTVGLWAAAQGRWGGRWGLQPYIRVSTRIACRGGLLRSVQIVGAGRGCAVGSVGGVALAKLQVGEAVTRKG